MAPRARKVALTAHVTFSVGWLGAVAAYLSLAVAALGGRAGDPYASLELLGWTVLVPLGLAALLTGLVQSVGTPWGLFRHWWVVAKLALTLGATTILLLHMPTVGRMASAASGASVPDAGDLPLQLVVHAAGGLVVLFTVTTLSIFKPWGMTPYGRRAKLEPVAGAVAAAPAARGPVALYVLVGLVAAILCAVVVLHLAGMTPRH